jgi:hypothetical protein
MADPVPVAFSAAEFPNVEFVVEAQKYCVDEKLRSQTNPDIMSLWFTKGWACHVTSMIASRGGIRRVSKS